ncbi:MAG: glycosyl hydrolase, partial [Bacteroidota bacterium]
MYRSDDGGRSWKHLGLDASFHIGRIVIDPKDENHVLVATTGALYETDETRGLYRTRDGGDTWEQILFLNEKTSCIDVAVNPWNPDIIYAAMWERVRAPWGRDYAGENSAIYRTRDGGLTWQRLENGLPQANRSIRGRIGLALSTAEPNTLYASFTQDAVTNEFDGVFKTTDGGDTWEETSRYQLIGAYSTFGWYFGNLRIDPKDPNTAYVLGVNLFKTTDGGQNWRIITRGMHVDQHALAIHPNNSDFMVAGNDGGVYVSDDAGMNWEHCDNLPITQFYQCGVSQEGEPAYYGGSQDNGTLKMGDSNIGNWTQVLGGDGFHTVVDPNNSEIVYAEYQWGNFFRSLNGGLSFQRHMNGINSDDRNNWNSPCVLDPSISA